MKREMYSPPEGSIGRCDADLLLQTVSAVRLICSADLSDPRVAAVYELLRALEAVTRGLWGDLRDVAAGAAVLAEELAQLRGPEVDHA